jgi:hypothetical protein
MLPHKGSTFQNGLTPCLRIVQLATEVKRISVWAIVRLRIAQRTKSIGCLNGVLSLRIAQPTFRFGVSSLSTAPLVNSGSEISIQGVSPWYLAS